MAPRCSLDEALAELSRKFLAKGSKVYVEGKLTTRKWQDQDGNDRYSTEIHLTPYNGTLTFLDKASSNSDHASDGEDASTAPDKADIDDEIPF